MLSFTWSANVFDEADETEDISREGPTASKNDDSLMIRPVNGEGNTHKVGDTRGFIAFTHPTCSDSE